MKGIIRWLWWGLIVSLSLALGGAAGWALRVGMTRHLLDEGRSLARSRVLQAETAYRQYLERRPEDSSARLELALLLNRRAPEAALAEVRKIARDDPQYAAAARQAAALALDLGRDYDAIGPLAYLEERSPDDAGVQLALAQLHFRGRNFEAALEHARRCRELRPDQIEALLVEAESLDELKRSTEMIEPLEAALQLDPELPQAHLNLAYACSLVGREDEALEHARWFVQRFPRSAAGQRTLAVALRARGQAEEALSAARASLALNPHQMEATLLEAELLLYLERPDEAYLALDRMQAVHGPDLRLLTLLLRAAQLSGREAEARNLRQTLTRLTAAGS